MAVLFIYINTIYAQVSFRWMSQGLVLPEAKALGQDVRYSAPWFGDGSEAGKLGTRLGARRQGHLGASYSFISLIFKRDKLRRLPTEEEGGRGSTKTPEAKSSPPERATVVPHTAFSFGDRLDFPLTGDVGGEAVTGEIDIAGSQW